MDLQEAVSRGHASMLAEVEEACLEALQAERVRFEDERQAASTERNRLCARLEAVREEGSMSKGEQETLLAARLDEEREKRVDHLQQIAARRIGQMGLARGWGAWHEVYAQKARHQQMLKGVGARMRKPALHATFGHWRQDWRQEVTM